MDYNFRETEKKWQKYWKEKKVYQTKIDRKKPKFYILDMFPYPSGSGLHVGHPLGYIASDIYARYKRHLGYNVLHPMGFDAYGLPAEQYAIQTGQHPAVTTEKNIKRYKEQLNQIGFSFDWSREVKTCEPSYYKWTQWTFIRLFNTWYDKRAGKAASVESLVRMFEKDGNKNIDAATDIEYTFTAEQWNRFGAKEKQEILMEYRLAYLSDTWVNWCPALGTVLANDEVKDGFSERGGYPVERKMMKQWLLRISAYAERLLEGLDTLDWSDSIKEVQKNWIGRSEGAYINFKTEDKQHDIKVFTTRPDTLFGVSFMVLAPEHPLTEIITTENQKAAVEAYQKKSKGKSERDRQAETKTVTGCFTGAYAVHPISGAKIPVWIADYVLMGYGTGAIMAVPAHDARDFFFARHFKLPITRVIDDGIEHEGSYDAKSGKLINSGDFNGMEAEEGSKEIVQFLEDKGLGKKVIMFRLRDAIFSRQRYWGEPFPVYYKDYIPYVLDESELPLALPEVDKYLPTETGEPPLARASNWKTSDGFPYECNTMPGFAGSSGYYLRYMDPHNNEEYFSKEANDYWQNVDLYLGGDEHATGHLIYARFWNMFLFDLGLACKEEPFQKLINQGKIQGRSNFVYRIQGTQKYVSYHLKKDYDVQKLHVDISLVNNDILDTEAFKKWRPEFRDAEFILENGKYYCGWEIEKMSKSKHNVQNPDDLIEQYGADTFRMYEMFLGPLENHKPWDTKGIEGVSRFMKKLWQLFHDENNQWFISDEKPSAEAMKVIHKTIKKVREDIERFSFNTVVSTLMICVNELSDLKCNQREVLEKLIVLLSPYAPHLAEELWERAGHSSGVVDVPFPEFENQYILESSFEYPVSFNGKMRFKLSLPVSMSQEDIKKQVLDAAEAQKWLAGKTPKKIIVVPKRIINVVV